MVYLNVIGSHDIHDKHRLWALCNMDMCELSPKGVWGSVPFSSTAYARSKPAWTFFAFFFFQQLVIEAAIMFQTCVAVHLHTAEKRPSDSGSVRCGVCLHISPRRRSGKLSAPHSLHHPTISPSFFCSLVANTLSIRRLKLVTHPPDTPLLACARRAASSHTQ